MPVVWEPEVESVYCGEEDGLVPPGSDVSTYAGWVVPSGSDVVVIGSLVVVVEPGSLVGVAVVGSLVGGVVARSPMPVQMGFPNLPQVTPADSLEQNSSDGAPLTAHFCSPPSEGHTSPSQQLH